MAGSGTTSADTPAVSATSRPQLKRRPLLGLTFAFTAGTALGLWLTPPPGPALAAAALVLFLVILLERRRCPASGILLPAALALAGCGGASLHAAPPSLRAQAVRNLDRHAVAGLHIRVTGDPFAYTTASGRPAWSVPATILAWHNTTTARWYKGRGRLTARWRVTDFRPAPRYGDEWIIHGRFDTAGHRASAAAGRERFWAWRTEWVAGNRGCQWVAACFDWRRAAALRLSAGIERFPDRIAVVHALLLGLRQGVAPELQERFAATGTLHVMAISGLHVGVMTALFLFVLRSLGVSRTVWFYFLAPLLIGYTLATGARPSAVRACIMALAYWSALPLRRRPDAPSALALAALIILAVNPRQLATPGFLFSFSVVAGLLVFFEPLYKLITRPLQARTDWRPPESPGIIRRELATLARFIAGITTVSVIAWTVAAPLNLVFFKAISLVALPANLAVVPLAFMIVVTGCLSLLSGTVSPGIGIVFNHANLVWTGALQNILAWFADRPGFITNIELPVWFTPLWYGVLVVLGWRMRLGKTGMLFTEPRRTRRSLNGIFACIDDAARR